MSKFINDLAGMVLLFVVFMLPNVACAYQPQRVQAHSIPLTLRNQVSYKVVFEYNALLARSPIVYVSINKQAPLPFLLDTGTDSSLCITAAAAKMLHLKVTYRRTALDTVAHRILPLLHVGSVALACAGNTGEQRFYPERVNEDAVIVDWPILKQTTGGKPLAGVIGVGMFAHDTIQLDFDARRLTIFPHAPALPLTSTMTKLPLKKLRKLYVVTFSDTLSHAVDALLDTGCDSLLLSAHDAALLPLLKTPYREWRGTFGGAYRSRIALLPALQLGTFTTHDVEIEYPDKKVILETQLGMNVLSRYRLTIDFPHLQLFLEPTAHTSRPRVRATPVIEIKLRRRQVIVTKVELGSAPARAGLRPGDRILNADHVSMRGLPGSIAQSVIIGYGNTQADLFIRSKGHQRHIRYLRYSLVTAIIAVDKTKTTSILYNNHRKQVPRILKVAPLEPKSF